MPVDHAMPVLVVDDHRTMIAIVRTLLRQIGFDEVDEATTGAEALRKLAERHHGLVVSDWYMDPMSGYDLLKEIRADADLAATRFIMVTAESKAENVLAAKKAGVDNYIVKPFNAQTLRTKISAVFGE